MLEKLGLHKIKALEDNKLFIEIYCICMMLLTFLFWNVSFVGGIVTFAILGILEVILFWDLKLLIPIVLFGIFVINKDAGIAVDNPTNNWLLYIIVPAFVLVMLIFTIIKGINLKKGKNKLPFLILAILCVLPLIWINPFYEADGIHMALKPNDQYLMAFYFIYVLYFIAYIVFLNGSKKSAIQVFIPICTYLPFLFLAQEAKFILTYPNVQEHISTLIVNLGWGISNEAGIMMLFVLPFIFYRLVKDTRNYKIIATISLIVVIGATLCTLSRGSMVIIPFMFFVLFLSYIIYLFKKKENKKKLILPISICGVLIIGLVVFLSINNNFYKLFMQGGLFSDAGRFDLYRKAWSYVTQNFLTGALGPGYITEIAANGRYVVYHSTIFQSLAMFGFVGLGVLIYHFYVKYKTVIKNFSFFGFCILISFIIVDLYGIFDNSYHMYYYMIYLITFLSLFENYVDNKEPNEDNYILNINESK